VPVLKTISTTAKSIRFCSCASATDLINKRGDRANTGRRAASGSIVAARIAAFALRVGVRTAFRPEVIRDRARPATGSGLTIMRRKPVTTFAKMLSLLGQGPDAFRAGEVAATECRRNDDELWCSTKRAGAP
jgi:hypothetical protein